MTIKLCANGQIGYSLDNGKSYTVKDPCRLPALVGHIFCDKCRVFSGGLRKKRVSLPAQPTPSKE
jgi:hypothetical protein